MKCLEKWKNIVIKQINILLSSEIENNPNCDRKYLHMYFDNSDIDRNVSENRNILVSLYVLIKI